jgi:small multidrug resistance family-3 protein
MILLFIIYYLLFIIYYLYNKLLCSTNQRNNPLPEIKIIDLFLITALAEIIACYLPYLWLREGKSVWLLIPAALSLAAFAWLLSLHPTAAGRVYAAYGGVYIFMAILWLWAVDGIRPTTWDIVGSGIALVGTAIIMFAPRST